MRARGRELATASVRLEEAAGLPIAGEPEDARFPRSRHPALPPSGDRANPLAPLRKKIAPGKVSPPGVAVPSEREAAGGGGWSVA